MKRSLTIYLAFIPLFLFGQPAKMTPEKYREDFGFFWKTIHEEYSYFDKKQTDWDKVKKYYGPQIDTVNSRDGFVSVLEKALYEIYDHHAILNTNTNNSFRLVPSGTDVWAEYVNGKPMILETRKGFGSEKAGVKAGMQIIAINDIPIDVVAGSLQQKCLGGSDLEAKNFCLRQALAGDHKTPRKFSLKYNGRIVEYYPDKEGMMLEHIGHPSMIESRLFRNTGYIKINDCLYDTELVNAFDSVMQTMKSTTSLILDFRDTPSGGNSIVARAILSWFITKDHFYQKHEYPAEERSDGVKRSWMEIVSLRKGKYYGKPLVILCDHWTASLGEAIVIGFDALKRPNTTIIGTPMARLCGAVYSFELPNSRIGFTFPAEKLYTIDGKPREEFVPGILIDLTKAASQSSSDIFIERALSHFNNKK